MVARCKTVTDRALLFVIGLAVARAACCCDFVEEETWEVIWCDEDESKIHFWGGIPTDGDYGWCSDWVGAGEEGDYSTITVTSFNSQFGSSISSCSEAFGSSSDCVLADTIMKDYNGNETVICRTDEATDALKPTDAPLNSSIQPVLHMAALALVVVASFWR